MANTNQLQAQAQQQYQATMAGYAGQEANFASMYGAGLNQYNQLYNQQAQFGAAQNLALRQQYNQSLAQNQQSMLARGLGNTTVMDAGARGVNYDYANSLLGLNDQLLQRQNSIRQAQLGYEAQGAQGMAGIEGAAAGFQGQYAGLLQQGAIQSGIVGQQIGAQYGLQGMAQSAQAQQLAGQQGMQTQQINAQNMSGSNPSQLQQQQYGQQAALQQSSQANQQQMQQASFGQQNFQADNFGYYAFPTLRTPMFSASALPRRLLRLRRFSERWQLESILRFEDGEFA